MRRRRARLARLVEQLTPVRILIALYLLSLFAGLLLVLSVLLEGEPLFFGLQARANAFQEAHAAAAAPAVEAAAAPEATPAPQPVAADDLNILLLGTDRRPAWGPSWRTDAIIVVAIRPQARLAAMLSIPRDLWVNIPGLGPNRINVADYRGEEAQGPSGGPALVATTLEGSLGIPIDAYVRVNFEGLEWIIDALGGITVTADRAYDEWLDDGASGLWHLQVAHGTQRMDGRTALGYARYRTDTSDLDRTRRQQEILLAMRDAALRPAVLPQLPRLLAALFDAVDTDLSPSQVLSLARLACQLDPTSYRTRVFDYTMMRDWITPGGAMVLLPDRARIEQAWAELTATQP